MILKLLTGGIDLPKLESRAIGNTRAIANVEIDLAAKHEERNAALADHIVKANARLKTIESTVSNNTAQCQIRMNGLQDLIGSRALAEDVETLRLKLERYAEGSASVSVAVSLSAQVAALTKQVEALTAAKLSEVKARKAPLKK